MGEQGNIVDNGFALVLDDKSPNRIDIIAGNCF
jgi:hypothetical protein